MRTSVIVHETIVDTEHKVSDLIQQLVMRLERRDNLRVGWMAIGPLPIRDTWRRSGDGQMFMIQIVGD